jgi:hypothetical protein
MGAPIAEDEFVRARGDLALRRALMPRALDLLLAEIASRRAGRPSPDSPAARELREGIDMALRLADRLQALTKTLDHGSPARHGLAATR